VSLAILDVDGTLVDTNYQHALAWYRAFCEHDMVLPLWRIHRHIGMGGDQRVPALTDKHSRRSVATRFGPPRAATTNS
jgi:beta-phosphoglucomutase-like phosphatase (HAD superfamily)